MNRLDTPASTPLTTRDVARDLGVSPATVKRWAETGTLPSVRTPGGHRRFQARDVAAVRERLSRSPGSLDAWVKRLLADPDRALAAAVHSERERLGSWSAVADALGPVIHEIGRAWEAGELCIAEEHTASTRLTRTLARACERLEPRASAPRALLATPAGEDHTLGLSLVELCMRERGWRASWAARSAPLEELLAAVGDGAVDVVALSASVASPPARLAAVVDALGPACRARGVALVVGGRGPWPEPLEAARRLRTFSTFAGWMADLEQARESLPRGGAAHRDGTHHLTARAFPAS
jgi:MerR family transcriptional regulator, light-induced transcriptional regulator